jgi:hypothetical protein
MLPRMAKPVAQALPLLHRPSPLPKSRPPRQAADGSVLATALARHLDVTHQRIAQMANEGIIKRLPSGRYNQDESRLRYLRWLRDPSRRVAKSQVDADFTRAKAELIQLRILEKRRTLIPLEYARSVEDKAIGVVLTAMSGMAARCGGSNLQLRRKIDQVVHETRVQLAGILNELADQAGEPPLSPTTDDTQETQ